MLVALISGGFGLVGGFVAGVGAAWVQFTGEIAKLREARRGTRADSLGLAQTGYRALYAKFTTHYETALQTGDGFDAVRSDFLEAQGIGFKPLNRALAQFWPAKRRQAGQPPVQAKWGGVEESFQTLFSVTPDEWDEWQDLGARGFFARVLRRSRAPRG